MRYVSARLKQNNREEAYRIYICDSLRLVTENTAKMVGGEYISKRLSDIMNGEDDDDDRTAEDIIADLVDRGCFKVVGENEFV